MKRHASDIVKDTYTFAEVVQMEAAAAKAIVERGIPTGADFRCVRKQLDLRAVDVAELFRVPPETVSRRERGEAPLPLVYAFVLMELYERPLLVRARLEALASATPPQP